MSDFVSAGIVRRLASMFYEVLLLGAILFIAALLFLLVFRDAGSLLMRPLFQIYLLAVMAGYFTWFWTHGGQTLAMKTWRLRLVSIQGTGVSLREALTRFVFALGGIGLGGFGLFWAFFDHDRQFLHDRLAGTKIIKEEG